MIALSDRVTPSGLPLQWTDSLSLENGFVNLSGFVNPITQFVEKI